jgi:large subunit ribosomal protein L25
MTFTLDVTKRQAGEKKEGFIPAVMYGAHAASTPIFIDSIAFSKVLKEAGESSIIKLGGDSNENVLIHDVQMDPVKYVPVHADLYVVEKGQKVHVEVPLTFVGVSNAVKNMGANLVKVMHAVSVEADPTNLPQEIEVDITKLENLDSNITVADINLPKGVELYHVNADDVVASVVAQSDEDLSAAVAQVDMENIGASVEKGKKEEEPAAE